MSNIKDNPVPSLTEEEIDYICENLLTNGSNSDIGYRILEKLNGVETNKVQPKEDLGLFKPSRFNVKKSKSYNPNI